MDATITTEKVYPRVTEKDVVEIDALLHGIELEGDVVPLSARFNLRARAKGRAEGKAVTLADIISWRYTECSQEILERIRTCVDPEFLERVGKAFATTNTFKEFLQKAKL